MMELILGSQSPRRKDILRSFSLPFIQKTSPFREEDFIFSGRPEEFVSQISQKKAEPLARDHPEAVIICADTIVVHQGVIWGKPKDRADAMQMLRLFGGTWQEVYTGVTVRKGEQIFTDFAETRVLFRSLTEREIVRYIDAVHAYDKAGAWAIQGKGELIVERIEGSYSNVVGLPVHLLEQLLRAVGLNLWEWL